MKKILFIGHDGNRTGAPLVLLHFLRWFAVRHPEVTIDLLLLRGGDLENEYRKVCNVFVTPDRKARPLGRRILHRLKRDLTGSDAIIDKDIEPFKSDYDLVVGNTIATLDHVAWFKKNNNRTISWIHELDGVIRIYFTPRRLRKIANAADRFVAASGAVKEALRELGVSRPIDVVYEFSVLAGSPDESVNDVRQELNIPHDAFIVGGSGSIEPRKGVDLFVETLHRVNEIDQNVYFVWIGGPRAETSDEYERIDGLARRLGVEDRLVFTGFTGQPRKYFAMLDLFALTSREDPFPLVCLEAAGLGKPVLCFAEAGGMPEFVGTDAGAVVRLADVGRLAGEIVRFKNDKNLLGEAGRRAMEKVENEFSMDRSCLALERLILDVDGL